MKEIKFRGKTFGGKWVEGYYVVEKSTGKHKITDGLLDIDEVKAETIGMGTGVLDKDGTEIFEGDVVQNGEGGYFYIVYWWDEDAAFRGKQVGSPSTIGLNYWRKELRIVGNIHDNPELLQYKPAPPKRRDHHTLLHGEFRIKGTCDNGCMCQPDVIYVARWLTKADGRGNDGRLRIWAHGSWVEDGKRYGSYCDWEKSILQNYEVLPDQMSREAYEKWKREYLVYPKENNN